MTQSVEMVHFSCFGVRLTGKQIQWLLIGFAVAAEERVASFEKMLGRFKKKKRAEPAPTPPPVTHGPLGGCITPGCWCRLPLDGGHIGEPSPDMAAWTLVQKQGQLRQKKSLLRANLEFYRGQALWARGLAENLAAKGEEKYELHSPDDRELYQRLVTKDVDRGNVNPRFIGL